MADHDDADPPVRQLSEDVGEQLLEIVVQALGGLVQQEDIRVLEQNLGQGGALLLTAGEVVRMPVQHPLQTAQGRHLPCPLLVCHGQQLLPDIFLQQEHLWILGQGREPVRPRKPLAPIGLPCTAQDA